MVRPKYTTYRKRIGWTLAALLVLLAPTTVRADSTEPVPAPTATQIEQMLARALTGADNRTSLNDRRAYVPALYRNATKHKFVLRELDSALATRWRADVELHLDLGDPPKGVIGLQNRRSGVFRLVFEHRDGRLELLRFHPQGQIELLPASG